MEVNEETNIQSSFGRQCSFLTFKEMWLQVLPSVSFSIFSWYFCPIFFPRNCVRREIRFLATFISESLTRFQIVLFQPCLGSGLLFSFSNLAFQSQSVPFAHLHPICLPSSVLYSFHQNRSFFQLKNACKVDMKLYCFLMILNDILLNNTVFSSFIFLFLFCLVLSHEL